MLLRACSIINQSVVKRVQLVMYHIYMKEFNNYLYLFVCRITFAQGRR